MSNNISLNNIHYAKREIRLRLIDDGYGCENGFVFKRTFPGKSHDWCIDAWQKQRSTVAYIQQFEKLLVDMDVNV